MHNSRIKSAPVNIAQYTQLVVVVKKHAKIKPRIYAIFIKLELNGKCKFIKKTKQMFLAANLVRWIEGISSVYQYMAPIPLPLPPHTHTHPFNGPFPGLPR